MTDSVLPDAGCPGKGPRPLRLALVIRSRISGSAGIFEDDSHLPLIDIEVDWAEAA